MDWSRIERNWPAFSEAILQRWPEASEADVLALDGRRAAFEDYIARLTGQDRAEAAAEIDAWRSGEMPSDIRMDESRDNANILESRRDIPPGEDPLSDDLAFGDDDEAEPPVGRD